MAENSFLTRRLRKAERAAKKSFTLRRIDLLLAILVTLAALITYSSVHFGAREQVRYAFIHDLELRSLDMRFRFRGARPHDPRIVIVGLDENTLQKVGAYPISRDGYAKMVTQLAKGGAKVVAFDFDFPKPETNSGINALNKLEGELKGAPAPVLDKVRKLAQISDNDKTLAAAIQKANNVILGYEFLDPTRIGSLSTAEADEYYAALWNTPFPQVLPAKPGVNIGEAWKASGGMVARGVYANITVLSDVAKSAGFFDEVADPDGTMRRSPLLIRYSDQLWFPSLALETVKAFEDIPNEQIYAVMAENGLERIQLGRHNLKTGHDGIVVTNFVGPYKSYTHYSMADVMDGTIPPETFRGKIVLFGATAKGIGDLRTVPFASGQPYMGVEMHANEVDNILHANERGRGSLTHSYREEIIDYVSIIFLGMVMGLVFSRARPLISTLSAFIAAFSFFLFAQFLLTYLTMWISVVVPALTLVVTYAAITSFRMIFEEREKRKVRRTFERYVSPGVISLIEQDPGKYFKAGGESKDLTVMFCDIRSFTSMSENLTPDELVALLNEYLGVMTDVIFEHGGTLDKYIGDAIMAIWGSPVPQPDHPNNACAAALGMLERLKSLNLKLRAEDREEMHIGIGLNSGTMNVGNMGSDQRFAWTVMGDNVNLASRLEGITKKYHVNCIVSEYTYRQTKEKFVFREIDRLRVKGKAQPVCVYQLLDNIGNESAYTELLVRFSEALAAYRRANFQEAADLFSTILERWPSDGPAREFLVRSLEFLREAPEPSWDGVYDMQSK